MSLYTPTVDGFAVFGRSVSIVYEINPRDRQTNSYAGVNGKETLDMGYRGATSRASGFIDGPTSAAVRTAELTFGGFQDGKGHTLINGDGQVFTDVQLISFKPSGPIKCDNAALYYRRYEAVFDHLR